MPQAMMRIISRPPGEAPSAVRDKWIGLVLPVVEDYHGPVGGVVTGGFSRMGGGYVVEWDDAMRILGEVHPEARSWWESNISGSDQLVFDRACAEILPD